MNRVLMKFTFKFGLKVCRLLPAKQCRQKVARVGSVPVSLERMKQNLKKENVLGKSYTSFCTQVLSPEQDENSDTSK